MKGVRVCILYALACVKKGGDMAYVCICLNKLSQNLRKVKELLERKQVENVLEMIGRHGDRETEQLFIPVRSFLF